MKWPISANSDASVIGQASRMEARMMAFDWSATALGPASTWPAALKSTIRLLLDCRLPMYLAWGPDFIWPTIGPMWAQVLTGEGIGFERFKLTIDRYGYLEDCYFSFSYSPVPDDEGKPSGVLVTFAETTREVLAERRQAFQLSLADALRNLDDPVAITECAAAMLGEYVGAGRAGYGEVDASLETVAVRRDWTDGSMSSLAGESRPLDSFGPNIIAELRAGRTLRLNDIGADPRSAPYAAGYASIGTRSLLVVPLMKNGAMAAILYLHCAGPHFWSDMDAAIAEDVAQRTWDAIERAHAQHALILADRRKDEFLAMLAHELRNPLAPISSAAQMLGLGRLDQKGVLEAGKIVARQVSHMATLLDDLLDVSRMTRGIVELDLQSVDLRTVVDTAIEQVRPQCEARRHRLRFSRPPRAVMVHGDFVRLVQVLANVLNNSAKYSPEGSAIAVTLSGGDGDGDGDGCARVTVQDTGSGIAPALLPHVFELFVQGTRTLGRTQGGLGLGLALVKAIVELHHGRVGLTSPGEGQGTTVTIDLPCVEADAPPEQESVPRAGAATAVSALRILLVDDNVDAAASLAMLLEQHGHRVTVAHNGRDAIALASATAPHVAILDIGLPDIDGYALIRKMRAEAACAGTRCIALTGYGRAEDLALAANAGFWRHLTKPAALATLFAYLDEAAAGPP